MYRQQAQRAAEKLASLRRDLCIEVYQDGLKGRNWLVSAYDPVTFATTVFENERDAIACGQNAGDAVPHPVVSRQSALIR